MVVFFFFLFGCFSSSVGFGLAFTALSLSLPYITELINDFTGQTTSAGRTNGGLRLETGDETASALMRTPLGL